jgi:hypothetical protein
MKGKFGRSGWPVPDRYSKCPSPEYKYSTLLLSSIIRLIKSTRMRWTRDVARMGRGPHVCYW